jgi:hypothetical protein
MILSEKSEDFMKRIMKNILIGVLFVTLLYGGFNYFQKVNIENNANQFLMDLQQERYNEVLNQLLLSDELKQSIKKRLNNHNEE